MKNLFIILIVILISANANAQSATTKAGYLACTSEQFLDDVIFFKQIGDRAAGEAYIRSKKCVSPQQGLEVTVLDTKESEKIQFDYKGTKFWTVTDALELN